MIKIVLIVVYVGGSFMPTQITGFTSLATCESEVIRLEKQDEFADNIRYRCVEVK